MMAGRLLAGCLVGGAVVLSWPTVAWRRRVVSRVTEIAVGSGSRRKPPSRVAARAEAGRLWDRCVRRPHRAMAVSGVAAVIVGWLAAGPVAAGVAGAYTALGLRVALRGATGRRSAVDRSRALDHLCALAADLRAGLPAPVLPPPEPTLFGPSPAGPPPSGLVLPFPTVGHTGPGRARTAGPAGANVAATAGSDGSGGSRSEGAVGAADGRLAHLIESVWRLAERTGAPAADLIERIEADARAADRARLSAAAQAAGAAATAWLLAGLPVGGVALGYAIGVDPLRVLLHSPLGAACALGAVILQAAGLAWTDRLAGARSR